MSIALSVGKLFFTIRLKLYQHPLARIRFESSHYQMIEKRFLKKTTATFCLNFCLRVALKSVFLWLGFEHLPKSEPLRQLASLWSQRTTKRRRHEEGSLLFIEMTMFYFLIFMLTWNQIIPMSVRDKLLFAVCSEFAISFWSDFGCLAYLKCYRAFLSAACLCSTQISQERIGNSPDSTFTVRTRPCWIAR